MTEHQEELVRVTWPIVVLIAICGGFFLGIFAIIPADMPEGRTALLGMLITSVGSVIAALVQRVSNKIERQNRRSRPRRRIDDDRI